MIKGINEQGQEIEIIYFSRCLKCGKELKSSDKIIKPLKEPVGLINSGTYCPYCNNKCHNIKTDKRGCEFVRVENKKGQEIIYIKKIDRWVLK